MTEHQRLMHSNHNQSNGLDLEQNSNEQIDYQSKSSKLLRNTGVTSAEIKEPEFMAK